MFYRYRQGLTKEEAEVIRRLRAKGWAIAILRPAEVGEAVNRGVAEYSMVRAGKRALVKEEAT
jgi:hypothetical protein